MCSHDSEPPATHSVGARVVAKLWWIEGLDEDEETSYCPGWPDGLAVEESGTGKKRLIPAGRHGTIAAYINECHDGCIVLWDGDDTPTVHGGSCWQWGLEPNMETDDVGETRHELQSWELKLKREIQRWELQNAEAKASVAKLNSIVTESAVHLEVGGGSDATAAGDRIAASGGASAPPRSAERSASIMSTSAGTNQGAFGPTEWVLFWSVGCIWGSSFLFMAIGLQAFKPGLITLLRIASGAADLALVPAARRPIGRSDWPRLVTLSVLWVALPFTLFPIAQQWISSAVTG
jgi:hypothetical protein